MEDDSKVMLFDLAIIGGGPAGCAAAITAARSGARVLLLERGRFPRHKVCGEFVSAESLGLCGSLLGGDSQSQIRTAPVICQARIFLDGATLHAPIAPAAASITRYDLDAGLWSACLAAGVCTHQETHVRSVEGNGHFRIETTRGNFDTKAVINASGRWSNFTSETTRAQMNGNKWLGIKAHYYEECAPHSVDLYFFDQGYCGVQPVSHFEEGMGMRINVCAMIRADAARSMDDVLRQHAELLERSRTWTLATQPIVTSPLVFHQPEPLQNSMLQIGDAATFVDPFIGDGISLAMRSGALAAECLAPFWKQQISLNRALENYSREYHKRLVHIFRASSRLRGLLRWPRAVRRPVVSALAKTPFLARQIVRMTR
ncbi:MAG TPA: FAD-dependent oxidoreductase [Terriglobales bacterium]|nr:FAD-dependent oxidoreductase [Terriglobales bacterium]